MTNRGNNCCQALKGPVKDMEDKQEVVANFAAALATSIDAEQSPSYLYCYKKPPDLLRHTGRLWLFLLLQGITSLFSKFLTFFLLNQRISLPVEIFPSTSPLCLNLKNSKEIHKDLVILWNSHPLSSWATLQKYFLNAVYTDFFFIYQHRGWRIEWNTVVCKCGGKRQIFSFLFFECREQEFKFKSARADLRLPSLLLGIFLCTAMFDYTMSYTMKLHINGNVFSRWFISLS